MVQRIELRPDYSISRIIKGGWHLAGGHGYINREQAIVDMLAFVEGGITTFDCADIYTGVEELIGQFLKRYKTSFTNGGLPQVQIHTKYVPDLNSLHNLKRDKVQSTIERSLTRLGVERLDLVQFHWWDYSHPGYLETIGYLIDLQNAGKIRLLGLTNFNHIVFHEILEAGADIVSHQVQYSLIDRRIEKHQFDLAAEYAFHFLCYGTIAGGFLSDRYFRAIEPKAPFENRSLTKYKLIIDDFGGWEQFQNLLHQLDQIAQKYEVGIAEIAIQFILQKNHVGGIIVGARNSSHLQKLLSIGSISLEPSDIEAISLVISQAKGPTGNFYDLERNRTGKHGAIMKYNLSQKE